MAFQILIVDDEPLVALDMDLILREAGYTVLGPARNVEEALQFIDRGGISAVVLDANLKGESGARVAAQLRARGLPFMAVTGSARDQVSDWLGEAGLLAKPFTPAALVAGVAGLVSHSAGLPSKAHPRDEAREDAKECECSRLSS